MRRRQLLIASAASVAAMAGCTGGGDNDEEEDMEGDSSMSPGEEAEAVVDEFYASYNDADLERTNELFSQQYLDEVGRLTEEPFEPFGGIENMEWTVNDTIVERESEELVEIHADTIVSTPAGSGDSLDFFLMSPEDGDWKIDMFLPANVREDMSQEEIDGAMQRE